jgi:putative transposase
MANTYSQIYIHIIFAVQGRENIIKKAWKNELYAYMGGIIKNLGSKPLAINGMPDHVHIFIGHNPATTISNLVEEIKTSSNKFIKENFSNRNFKWQKGYGRFAAASIFVQSFTN